MNKNYTQSLSIANILLEARSGTDVSQEKMAMELHVSKNTIINWEKGTSQPTVFQALNWFKVVGKNPMRPFLRVLFPETFNVDPRDSDESIKEAVISYIDCMPPKTIRQLAYLFFGEHQSSPISVMEMVTAHLHNDMRSRVVVARTIADSYDMCLARNQIVCEDNIKPDMELLNKSIELGKKAYMIGLQGYSVDNPTD